MGRLMLLLLLPKAALPNVDESLACSLLHVGAMAGSLMGGILIIYLGQRGTLLLAIPFCLVLWLSMSFTSAVWVLLLLRALLGITQGIIGNASTNYLAEVTQSEIRGRLMTFLDIGRQSGILLYSC
ncbi:Sugar transporter ERD6-like 11 [Chionoecetes opilio]|uniref:Sugar transporter ERD6-like 11 n=1 Tax=Chionoecetes opilio TaxID=41210 RepID=A0A8J4YCV4_CHIOP|nr:Sugar transporter ERD6-like 11 [Chionoecetes opilio]